MKKSLLGLLKISGLLKLSGLLAISVFTGCASMTHNIPNSSLGNQVAISAIGNDYQYLRYLPENYDATRKWPVVIFLHGSGERGTDINRVSIHGPPRLVREGQDFEFILISPQLPEGQMWNAARLDAMLANATHGLNIDEDRIYLTGLSLGGMGTWGWAISRPNLFAAIAPVCGMANPFDAEKLIHLPVWAFHGALDDVVPPAGSRYMVNMINGAGGNARLSLYPDANHDSWTRTYNNRELYDWLLAQRRNRR